MENGCNQAFIKNARRFDGRLIIRRFEMNLYINACPREDSRTDRLARKVLEKFESYDEIYLPELNLQPLSRERLDYRTKLIEA